MLTPDIAVPIPSLSVNISRNSRPNDRLESPEAPEKKPELVRPRTQMEIRLGFWNRAVADGLHLTLALTSA
jgi:hypothetical protein